MGTSFDVILDVNHCWDHNSPVNLDNGYLTAVVPDIGFDTPPGADLATSVGVGDLKWDQSILAS